MTFSLTITTLSDVLFHGDAKSVTLPGSAGELTVLAKHMPLVTPLRQGTITVRTEGGEENFSVEKGILEVSREKVTVLLLTQKVFVFFARGAKNATVSYTQFSLTRRQILLHSREMVLYSIAAELFRDLAQEGVS